MACGRFNSTHTLLHTVFNETFKECQVGLASPKTKKKAHKREREWGRQAHETRCTELVCDVLLLLQMRIMFSTRIIYA